jgi:hypothetical protein
MAALALHACATAPSADQSSSCGPAERAAKTVHTVTGVIGKYYDRCAEDFDLIMCNPVNLVLVTPAAAVGAIPGAAAGAAVDDKVYRNQCPHEVAPAEQSAETKDSPLEAPQSDRANYPDKLR